MNSLGTSSKWPSNDSLPSTSSYVHSESEHTEDEAELFSDCEGDSGKRLPVSAGRSRVIRFSGNHLDFPPYLDQPLSRSRREQSKHSCNQTAHPDSASSTGAATLGPSSATPGDLAFAQKCADLHRFTCPLLELLQGLKTGRFDKGLTGFQQSVAIDRLHRILGVLQKPDMGEKYLQSLLQIEMMLKIWFPRLAFQSRDTTNQTIIPQLPPHWHQNQLHMPVKKRKLSWSDHDNAGKVPAEHKHHQHETHEGWHALNSLDTAATCLPGSPKKKKTPDELTVESVGHKLTVCIDSLNKPSYFFVLKENDNRTQPELSPPVHCGSPATQDNSVSSSDTVTANDSP